MQVSDIPKGTKSVALISDNEIVCSVPIGGIIIGVEQSKDKGEVNVSIAGASGASGDVSAVASVLHTIVTSSEVLEKVQVFLVKEGILVTESPV